MAKGSKKLIASDGEGFIEKPAKRKTPAKKVKGNLPKKGGRLGKLAIFNSMPIDILREICTHLDVPTLLALTKTNSMLRNLVTSPSGASLWKEARGRVRLPDLLANDLNEWYYAKLVYSRNCHICQKPRAVTVNYTLRARCCASCMRSNSKRVQFINGVHPRTFECIPSNNWNTYIFYWIPTARYVSTLLYSAAIQPTKTGEESPLDQLIKRLSANARNAEKDGAALEVLESQGALRKYSNDKEIVIQRQRRIETNMRELGFTDEDFNDYNWQNNSLVTAPKELTEQIWKRIKSPLTEVLQSINTTRKDREFKLRQTERGNSLRPFYDNLVENSSSQYLKSTFIPFNQFLQLSKVQPLWYPETAQPVILVQNTPVEEILAEVQKARIQFEIATFSKIGKAHAEADALPVTGSISGKTQVAQTNDMNILASYAISSFACGRSSCLEGVQSHFESYPQVLDHIKSSPRFYFSSPLEFDDNLLQTSGNQVQVIRLILDAVGLDHTTTCKELYALGAIFLCDTESCLGWNERRGSKAMFWSDLVTHCLVGHYAFDRVYSAPGKLIIQQPTKSVEV